MIKKNKIKIKKITSEIENINNLDLNNFNEKTKLFIEQINEKYKEDTIDLGIIIDDLNENEKSLLEEDEENEEDEEDKLIHQISPANTMKIIYFFFNQKKYIPSISMESFIILSYLSGKYINKEKIDNEKIIKKIENNNVIINKLKNFKNNLNLISIEDNYTKKIMDTIDSGINNINKTDNIYIPILGNSNVGKTTLINCIIGSDLFPVNLNECTKKGIIINHWEYDRIMLSKIFIKKMNTFGKTYYYFEDGDVISVDYYEIKNYLKDFNCFYEDKEEKFFYKINIKIKLLEQLKIKNDIKQKINFIDFPGFGTDIKIETKNTYKKVMNICNSFIFVVRNSTIKEEKNKDNLKTLFNLIKHGKSSLLSSLINSCLFIINCDIEQSISDKDLLKNQIKLILKLKDTNNINICFFNAFYYLHYIKNLNYFLNIRDLFIMEAYNYQREKHLIMNEVKNIFYGGVSLFKEYILEVDNSSKDKSKNGFLSYINKKLEERFRKEFEINIPKKYNIKENIKNKIEEALKIIHCKIFEINQINEKNKINIGKILSYAEDKIELLNKKKLFYIEDLIKCLNIQINYSEKDLNLLHKIFFKNFLDNLDLLFIKDFDEERMNISEKNKIISYIEEQKENINKITEEECINGPIKIIKDYLQETINKINNKKVEIQNPEIDLDKIENELKYYLSNDLKVLQNNFIKDIDRVSTLFSKILIEIQEKIKSFNFKEEKLRYQKINSLKENIDKSISISEDQFGITLFNDIISSSFGLDSIYKKGLIKMIKSIFSKKNYLENVMDLLVENISITIKESSIILTDKINDYNTNLLYFIETFQSIFLINFTGKQKELWIKTCEEYEEMKKSLI